MHASTKQRERFYVCLYLKKKMAAFDKAGEKDSDVAMKWTPETCFNLPLIIH